MPLVSVVTGCYNEEGNIDDLVARIRAQFALLPAYDYEHILIDNASTDATVERIKALAREDKRIRLIVNARNFGHVRSPVYAILQARGDIIISMASDLQDPPELIPEFIKHWEDGFRIVAGIKSGTRETLTMRLVRGLYYRTIGRISDTRLIPHFTGFGLYDRSVIEIIREIDDPYPYFRGLIADIGLPHAEVSYTQPSRKRGISKNNFYTLYDLAMLGITSHSKVPLRLATMGGFTLATLSLMASIGYLVFKLLFWDEVSFGLAPILIGGFFFASVQLFFIGLLGEYIAAMHTQILKRPLVIEKERVNFD